MTANSNNISTSGLSASTLEFPPLPETWEIVVENDGDELALKMTQVMLDSDDEDESEMWETFEHDSKPAYTEVAARGKVYHELQKAGEVMMGVKHKKKANDNKAAAAKDPRVKVRNEIAVTVSAVVSKNNDGGGDDDDDGGDGDGDVKGKNEYENRKTQGAQKIHHKIIAKKHNHSLGAQLTDAVAKDDALHKVMPIWETIRDSDGKDRVEKRKAFEINKQLKKDIKMRRMNKFNGGSRSGGFRDEGRLPVLV